MPSRSAPRNAVRISLSRRLLRLTLGVVLMVQVLFFVPAIIHAREDWLQGLLMDGELAALAMRNAGPATTTPVQTMQGLNSQDLNGQNMASRAALLRLAGAESVRLLPPGGQPIELNSVGQFEVTHVIDLRDEGQLATLTEAASGLIEGIDQLMAARGVAPVQPNTLVTVVFHSRDLTAHLRAMAGNVALLGLAVAAITGVVLHLALRVLLVRPMRQLTDSIAAFRADPERAPPSGAEPPAAPGADEVATAGRELAAMQRELRAALWRYARLAALGTAVAKVSHDLRGILAPALLGAERLQGNDDPVVRRIGDQLVRSVERATDLVRSGLEFAREGPVTLTRQRFALLGVVTEAAEQARAAALEGSAAPGLTVTLDIDPALEVDADSEHITRVLANLIRNAAEAGATEITVAADVANGHGCFSNAASNSSARAGETVITVTDNGPGLLERVRTSLFKPFVMGARKGSSGLGLAIARDLMRAHLGDIALLRTGPNGTAFQLTLPPALYTRPAVRQAAAAE